MNNDINVCESTKCIVKMMKREIKLIFRANITVQFGTYIGSINSVIRSLERSNEVSN